VSCYPPDWSRPWWCDWRPWVEPVWDAWQRDSGEPVGDVAGKLAGNATGNAVGHSVDHSRSLHAVLNLYGQQAPVQFVPQAALPEGESYEGFIFSNRQVPTRDNLHDLFNGCCWQRFPRTKARLNVLQAEVIGRDGVGATRGPLRDALTLFDENALLLQISPAWWDVLRRHDWTQLMVTHRQHWRTKGLAPGYDETPCPAIRPVVFGHALLEKLCQPYKSITAHAYWIDPAVPPDDDAWDAWLAERLDAAHMGTKPFQPLPVMGIPGWSDENAAAEFYADTHVFRPLSPRNTPRG